jgi:MOSC domain-containing protein YiiM
MDLSFRHDLWIRRLPASPTDEGRLTGIVVRPAGEPDGTRQRPERARLTPEEGVVGDRWSVADGRPAGTQVSLINQRLLSELANGDPERMALSGDNLQVDLDLSEANLPVGTRLEIGEVVLEVSPEPHRPCRSFHDRYGATAAKRVARANRLGLRGRGVLCAVVQAGELSVGDAVRVRRP